MANLEDQHRSLLEKYTRSIVHLRHQVNKGRFGLVFGSGLSADLKIPNWKRLVDKLAAHPDIEGTNLLQKSAPREGLSYRTQMLFEHYRRRIYESEFTGHPHNIENDAEISSRWSKILQESLYENIDKPLDTYLANHSYLKELLPLIRRSQITVTYNFDDFIEQSLLSTRSEEEAKISRGFESVSSLWAQFRRQNAIIYHPNGIVPQVSLEGKQANSFVFSESSFAEKLIGVFAGDQAPLLTHFAKNTCLFIGLSLEDETLRSVLMQCKRTCPGNFHYYVHYIENETALSDEEKKAITLANFKVYNLITLFLNASEIRTLAELIDTESCFSDDFCDFARVNGIRVLYKFYVTGPLGVGKSTTIQDFGNLNALDEWLAPRFELLEKHPGELDRSQTETVDRWIADQFRLKNDNARRAKEGIVILDRGPLDPLAFTPTSEWTAKAGRLLSAICPGSNPDKVEDGKVILLTDDVKRLEIRMVNTNRRKYTAEILKEMESSLMKAYGPSGVEVVEVRGWGRSDVARRVAEIVHLDDYEPVCDLQARLELIQKDGFDAVM